MPFWKMPNSERDAIWDDGVHFTVAGYDLMGSMISKRIIKLTSELERAQLGANVGLGHKSKDGHELQAEI